MKNLGGIRILALAALVIAGIAGTGAALTDSTVDWFTGSNGNPVSGYDYTDIISANIEQINSTELKATTIVNANIPGFGWHGYRWFLDTDKNSATGQTGYLFNDIGADYWVEVAGSSGSPNPSIAIWRTGYGLVKRITNYNVQANKVWITFSLSDIGNPESFYWIADTTDGVSINDHAPDCSHGTFSVTSTPTTDPICPPAPPVPWGSSSTSEMTPTTDSILPTISIFTPSTGQTFTASTIIMKGSASDNIGLSKVEVKVDTGFWQLASGTTSWSAQVTLSPGTNQIIARAIDTSGNEAATATMVNYNAPAPIATTPLPVVTTLPAEPIVTTLAQPAGTISVSSSPAGASIYLDGSYQGKTSYTISDVAIGTHLIELRLNGYKDWADTIQVKAGSISYVSVQLIPAETAITPSYTITHTPDSDKSPPSISISKPEPVDFNKNKQLDEGEKLVITYGANDESGIKSIKVSLDGNLIELRSNEGIYSVTTDSLSMGEHTIAVEAIDLKGNKKSEEMKVNARRAGPSIYPQKTKYEVNEGEDVKVVLAAVNPIGNPKMDAQLILKPPSSGVSVYESDCKGNAGMCTSQFEVESGDSVKPISVKMRADRAGEYQVDAEIYYQYEDGTRSPPRYETLTLEVKPKPQAQMQTPNPDNTQAPSTPGFEFFSGIFGLLIIILIVKGIKKVQRR